MITGVLKRFREDFGTTPQKGLAGVVDYVSDVAVRRLLNSGNFSVSYSDDDWSLSRQ